MEIIQAESFILSHWLAEVEMSYQALTAFAFIRFGSVGTALLKLYFQSRKQPFI